MTRRFNSLGFWAIGSGAPAALSSLSFHISPKQLTVYSSVPEAVYFSLAAKFMAESVNDVGRTMPCTWSCVMGFWFCCAPAGSAMAAHTDLKADIVALTLRSAHADLKVGATIFCCARRGQ